MDDLDWLMNWYQSQCNDEWEHSFGIRIDTLVNPGWTVTIDLEGIALEDRRFVAVEHDIQSDVSWWSCRRDCDFPDLAL